MSSCVTVPTETQFQVVTTTSNSLSTSFSTAVTTLPPSVLTSTIGCSGSASNSVCSPTILTVTGAASTSTTTVPVTVTVPVTLTASNPTRTLFSTSCSSNPTSVSTSPRSTSSTLTSQSSFSTPTPLSSSTPVSTDSSVITSSALTTTLSNGNVVTTQVFVTTSLSPTSVVATATASASLNQSGTGGGKSSPKTASIIGGTVGGVIAVLAIIGGIWYVWRRSKRWNDIFEKEEDEEKNRPRMSLDGEDVQPRPYHYGLVGHSSSPSPPGSPPLGAVDPGHSPSNSLSFLNARAQPSRSSSGVALSSPGSMSRSLSDLSSANPAQPGHTRPSLSTASSAAASTRPLLERPVNHTRSPSDLLGAGRSQAAHLSSRPHSAGGSLQGGSALALARSADAVPRPQTSPVNEKRRLLANLPQGAAAPTPPSLAIESGSSPVQFPRAEVPPPPIRQRNPNRPSSAKGSSTVTVHVDGGPAAESEERSPPEGNEPPAYSPT